MINTNGLKPTYLMTVAGYRFYEHPHDGDESPMLVEIDGQFYQTDWWDRPDDEEIEGVESFREWGQPLKF